MASNAPASQHSNPTFTAGRSTSAAPALFPTPHRKYLKLADGCVGLAGKRVLEVGGCTPPSLTQPYDAAQWTCVNLDAASVAAFNRQAEAIGAQHCRAVYEDFATFQTDGVYDVIYSINSFEHIQRLDEAFSNMHRALAPGGYLFTLFGPLWSSDVGHHLSIPTDRGPLHFFDGILEPWEHLTSTPEVLRRKLETAYGAEVAERAVNFIYKYPDLNRLCEHQYLNIVRRSLFKPVLVLKNSKGKPPKVAGASGTRELMFLLKKGDVGRVEQVGAFARFAWTYLHARNLA